MAKTSAQKEVREIVIDESCGLVFSSEEELFEHFRPEIEILEKELFQLKSEGDFSEEEMKEFEAQLAPTLESPDEIWSDKETIEGKELRIYIREFPTDDGDEESIFHIAITYIASGIPSFVYLHFPTQRVSLVEKYQRGEIVFDRLLDEAAMGAIDGDALLEGDELAVGLYKAMLLVRSHEDLAEKEFRDYAHLREPTIEEADEIWRNNDSFGNVLVHFIKEFPDEHSSGLTYIVATIEDSPSETHALLFSFPTIDKSLVDRYRLGENLQADEIVQEASH